MRTCESQGGVLTNRPVTSAGRSLRCSFSFPLLATLECGAGVGGRAHRTDSLCALWAAGLLTISQMGAPRQDTLRPSTVAAAEVGLSAASLETTCVCVSCWARKSIVT